MAAWLRFPQAADMRNMQGISNDMSENSRTSKIQANNEASSLTIARSMAASNP